MNNPDLIELCVEEMENEKPEMKRNRVKNISRTRSRDLFGSLGEKVAEAFPGYIVLVDGGPFRNYDYWFYADVEKRKIYLDFYSNITNTNVIVADIIKSINTVWVCPKHDDLG